MTKAGQGTYSASLSLYRGDNDQAFLESNRGFFLIVPTAKHSTDTLHS